MNIFTFLSGYSNQQNIISYAFMFMFCWNICNCIHIHGVGHFRHDESTHSRARFDFKHISVGHETLCSAIKEFYNLIISIKYVMSYMYIHLMILHNNKVKNVTIWQCINIYFVWFVSTSSVCVSFCWVLKFFIHA